MQTPSGLLDMTAFSKADVCMPGRAPVLTQDKTRKLHHSSQPG